MSLPPDVIEKLPPETYLHPECFYTDFDDRTDAGGADYGERYGEAYRRGLATGRAARAVGVNYDGAWFSEGGASLLTTSREVIGRHAHTQGFWAGVLASGCAVKVRRWAEGDHIREHVIKPERPRCGFCVHYTGSYEEGLGYVTGVCDSPAFKYMQEPCPRDGVSVIDSEWPGMAKLEVGEGFGCIHFTPPGGVTRG